MTLMCPIWEAQTCSEGAYVWLTAHGIPAAGDALPSSPSSLLSHAGQPTSQHLF
jgi:hypothetical protein